MNLDRDTHRARWAALSFRERRRILRAVNRGRAVEDRRDAALAVGAARMQQRFWRWAWLLVIPVSLLSLREGTEQFLTSLALGLGLVGGMSWFFHRRARRAEEANLALLEQGRRSGHRRREHLPRAGGSDHLPRPRPTAKRKRRRRRRRR